MDLSDSGEICVDLVPSLYYKHYMEATLCELVGTARGNTNLGSFGASSDHGSSGASALRPVLIAPLTPQGRLVMLELPL